MGLLDWLVKSRKSLSQMTRSELRRQELLMEKERARLLNKITKLSKGKQTLFERGSQEKSPEVRRVLAQEFETKTTEQLMIGRQLNIRAKELMTVSRLRMIRENADRAKTSGATFGLVSEKDILRLTKLIERDEIRAEVYQERLDEVLAVGRGIDEGAAGLSEAGQTVMNIWDKMDAGAIEDTGEAFDEADRRVREQQGAAEA
ncbi:MAG: hypothetical protein GY842_15575 [bacterium]|nr:hypothetical protein [bacterium]